MQKILNFFRGNISAEVECPYPERFVNICAQNDVEFWDLKRISSTTARITMRIGGYRKLLQISERAEFSIRPIKKKGVPFFLWGLRKRYALLAGMFLCVAFIWGMTLFIWEIDVYGNEKVSAQDILAALETMGVDIGTFGHSIVSEALAHEVLLEIPELSWFAINVSGSRATVLVRERVSKPEIINRKEPAMIYAAKPGILTKMNVMEGKRVFTSGETVMQGDIIVTGIMDSISSGTRFVHAMAEVYARTWYEMSAQIPLSTAKKNYVGREKTKTSIIIAGKRINLYFNAGISWASYDKITQEQTIKMPTGNVLPITIIKEVYAEYVPVKVKLTEESAEKLLKEGLIKRLEAELNDGEIVETVFEAKVEKGVMTVTMKAECMEQIGAERSFTENELLTENAFD